MPKGLHTKFCQIVYRDCRTGAVVDREGPVPVDDAQAMSDMYRDAVLYELRRRQEQDDLGVLDDVRPQVQTLYPHTANAVLKEMITRMGREP